ncbi:Pentatricopeptide repeat-containing protein [Rhynchospora pubera]|uniref:Pentatricopeptide repeat-containing protein n=1 Tax=Rhynchospora pubera TaxID=906938 RepID=A0AAV8GBI2_9POAL|nr:Pentatricopeptide repeat-containing protein [Rhynchospora pubera]
MSMQTKLTPQPSSLPSHILSLIDRCSSISHLKQIHSHLITHGHGGNQPFLFKLIRLSYLSFSSFSYSRLIFSSLKFPNVFIYTAMLTAYSQKSDSFSVLQLFVEMLRRGDAKPNEFVYPLVLRACSEESDLNLFKSVHGHAIKSLFGEFGILQSSLLDGYVRLGDVKTARELFDGMPERNIVCWTALVSGYARVGKVGNAIALFNQMPERDVPSWNAIISGCAHNGFNSEAVTFFQKMVESGARPNKTTIFCTLSACGHMGMLRLGKQMHGYAYRTHTCFDSYVVNALVDMYGKCGCFTEAQWIFENLSDKSLSTWNSLINCFALQGHSEIAVSTFDRMQESGVVPDEITFVGLLNACTHGGFVNQGLSYFYNMTLEYGIEPSIEHYGCVIDLLSRAGRFIEAIDIINNMKIKPDEVIWGSILNGCRIYREKDLAEIATKKLLELDPNNADYTVILANMCSESGLWDEMRTVRKVMRDTESKKLPGCSWVEVNKRTWQFYSGDRAHPESDEIYRILDNLSENLESVSSM